MLNIIATEMMKLKKDRLILTCTIIGLLVPFMTIGTDIHYLIQGTFNTSITTWISSAPMLYQLLAYPVLSGFVITFLIQREYGDHTIINTLTAPVERIKFLGGKIIMWAMWHVALTFMFFIILCIGIYILFGKVLLLENLSFLSLIVFKGGILNLITLMPIAWIAVLQRKTFYPSLLCTLIVTVVGFAGLYWPAIWANLIPWAAVYVVTIPEVTAVGSIPYVSIMVCGMVGVCLAGYAIKHQEI